MCRLLFWTCDPGNPHFAYISHWFPAQIGVFLGDGADGNASSIRSEFCGLFDFQDVPILAALRTFLQAFQLPKEAQQIDRVYVRVTDSIDESHPIPAPSMICSHVCCTGNMCRYRLCELVFTLCGYDPCIFVPFGCLFRRSTVA